jgi:hypothetical protein
MAGNQLAFHYQVENNGPGGAYLMDALRRWTAWWKTRANDPASVVILRDQAEAVIGKFVRAADRPPSSCRYSRWVTAAETR